MKKIWVVEIHFEEEAKGHFAPTVAVGLSRDDARQEMRKWKQQNTGGCRFRISAYYRVSK